MNQKVREQLQSLKLYGDHNQALEMLKRQVEEMTLEESQLALEYLKEQNFPDQFIEAIKDIYNFKVFKSPSKSARKFQLQKEKIPIKNLMLSQQSGLQNTEKIQLGIGLLGKNQMAKAKDTESLKGSYSVNSIMEKGKKILSSQAQIQFK